MTLASRNRLTGLALAALILIADQAVKWWVTGPLALREVGDQIVINSIFNLTRTDNYGVSLASSPPNRPKCVGRWWR